MKKLQRKSSDCHKMTEEVNEGAPRMKAPDVTFNTVLV